MDTPGTPPASGPESGSGSTIVRCQSCGTRNRVPNRAIGSPRCSRCKSPVRWVVDADDETFAAVATSSSVAVLLDVWAPWCGPCRAVSPALERIAQDLAGRIKVVKVNADDAPAVSARFEVRAIPTLLVLQGEEVVASQTGAAPEQQLRSWVEAALSS